MRVAVHAGGEVIVTVPHFFSASALERFLEKYSGWIAKNVARADTRDVVHAEKARIHEYKRQALSLSRERCAHYARVYGISHGKISVRAQKSRWGSCSKAGNLSFNYKIALLPPELADYIVVHEICHLLAFDHSRRFWNAVEKTVPGHKALRKRLRNTVVRFS